MTRLLLVSVSDANAPKRSLEDVLIGLTRPYISAVRLDPPWMERFRHHARTNRELEREEDGCDSGTSP